MSLPGRVAIGIIRRYQERARERSGDPSLDTMGYAYTIESIARYGLLVGGVKGAIQLGRQVRRRHGGLTSGDRHD
jgi:hypothetical protein